MEQQIFKSRRQQLLATLDKGEMAIVANAPLVTRNRDVFYRYRPDSDFYYLTGFHEPNAVAVFIPGRSTGQYILFNQKKDATKERWEGLRVGQVDACDIYGAEEAFAIEDFNAQLSSLLAACHTVYIAIGRNAELEMAVANALKCHQDKGGRGSNGPVNIKNIESIVHEQRVVKTSKEIARLQQAVDITVKGHERLIRHCRPGLMEYELEAELNYEFTRAGSASHAYPPIVAAGKNGCVLHYIDNNAKLNEGDLLLVDAGAEYHYYAADVTRTIPINGQFSEAQRAVYEIVLQTQLAVIDAIKPGVTFDELNKLAAQWITEGLLSLGLLQGKLAQLIADKTYQRYFMHGIGHWLGLDVHDVGLYYQNKQAKPLVENMVFTVEPGLYISPAADVPSKFHHIAVRIEDDVCVTATGSDVLSKALPKTVEAIETMMRN